MSFGLESFLSTAFEILGKLDASAPVGLTTVLIPGSCGIGRGGFHIPATQPRAFCLATRIRFWFKRRKTRLTSSRICRTHVWYPAPWLEPIAWHKPSVPWFVQTRRALTGLVIERWQSNLDGIGYGVTPGAGWYRPWSGTGGEAEGTEGEADRRM